MIAGSDRKVGAQMDLESNPQRAAELCCAAQTRLRTRVAHLTEEQVRAPSRLPGWSVGHVLTHLARNADAHARRLSGALRGEDLPKYANGPEQRGNEIEAGAGRAAAEIIADVENSQSQLEEVFMLNAAAGWPHGDFLGGGHYGVSGCPAHRLREVEMHHVDLDWATPLPIGRMNMSSGIFLFCWPRSQKGSDPPVTADESWPGWPAGDHWIRPRRWPRGERRGPKQ